jgi:aqualysin 1
MTTMLTKASIKRQLLSVAVGADAREPRTVITVSATSRILRRSCIAAAVLAAASLSALASAQDSPAPAQAASTVIPGQFIVTLRPGVDATQLARESRGRGADIDFVYSAALNGFAGRMSTAEVRRLRTDGRVAAIEADQTVSVNTDVVSQSPVTWGLDRIDQRGLPLSGSYGATTDARGVTAYVIDTGIRANHVEFEGRTTTGYGKSGDCNGHGTHVAGTIGGKTYGVAKKVTLVPVRVLGCSGSGTWSEVIKGMDWVVTHHVAGKAVANMSLGGGKSDAVNSAVKRVTDDGVVLAVAAGNSGANACNYSPASAPSALTVGATSSVDARASWSNFGTCLDLFAPGVSITSAWHSSTTSTNTISGTSMASPHVAGAAALRLVTATGANAKERAGNAESALLGGATEGVVSPITIGTGSPNLLLYTR